MENLNIKNKADEQTIKKVKKEYLVSQSPDYHFFQQLPFFVKDFFYQVGYIPKGHIDASNFLNSLAGINEKTDFDISYALTDIAPEKQFTLNQNTFMYAFYPKVWNKLAIEDRLVCTNFAFKQLLSYYNLNKEYRLTWFSQYYKTASSAFINTETKDLNIRFDQIINQSGLKIYSLLAHEINHIKQKTLGHKILKTKKSKNLNTYEQSLNSNNALTAILNIKNYKSFLDEEHQKKYLSVCNTNEWQKFLNNIYRSDLLEISSHNVQRKMLVNITKQCYEYYGEDCKINQHITNYCNVINDAFGKQVGERIFGDINQINNFKNLCAYNHNRLMHLNKIFNDIKNEKITNIPQSVYNELATEYIDTFDTQKYIFNTFIDIYENNNRLPESFDKNMFNKIEILMQKQNETKQDTIDNCARQIKQKNNDNKTNENIL